MGACGLHTTIAELDQSYLCNCCNTVMYGCCRTVWKPTFYTAQIIYYASKKFWLFFASCTCTCRLAPYQYFIGSFAYYPIHVISRSRLLETITHECFSTTCCIVFTIIFLLLANQWTPFQYALTVNVIRKFLHIATAQYKLLCTVTSCTRLAESVPQVHSHGFVMHSHFPSILEWLQALLTAELRQRHINDLSVLMTIDAIYSIDTELWIARPHLRACVFPAY